MSTFQNMDSQRLIKMLNENFPVHQPLPPNSTNLIMYRAGSRAVVDYLIEYFETDKDVSSLP